MQRLKITGVLIAVFLLAGLAWRFVFNNQPEAEKQEGGGPKIEQQEVPQSGFIYEKREILAYRPNNHNRAQITGFLKRFSGEETLLYSFIDDPLKRVAQKRTLIPTTHITKDGYIFLSGVGENNFVILDEFGDNINDSFRALKNHMPLGNFLVIDTDKAVFTKDNALFFAEKNKIRKIMEIDLNDDFFPKLEGYDSASNSIFIKKAGINSFAEIFRLDLNTKTLTHYESLKGARSDQVAICAENKRAIFIRHGLDPTKTPYGEPVPPSSLMMLDLQSDTATEIISSQKLFTNLNVSCASERLLTKEGKSWRFITFHGKELRHKLSPDEDVKTLSSDGKKAVTSSIILLEPLRYGYFLKNIKSGDMEWEKKDEPLQGNSQEISADIEPKIRYSVIGNIQLSSALK